MKIFFDDDQYHLLRCALETAIQRWEVDERTAVDASVDAGGNAGWDQMARQFDRQQRQGRALLEMIDGVYSGELVELTK